MLYVKVIDKDLVGSDDPMGQCAVKLDSLQPGTAIDVWMKLQEVEHGEIHLVLSYTPNKNSKNYAPSAGPSMPLSSAQPAPSTQALATTQAQQSGGEITYTREEMEAIVRAVFEDGRKFGAREG